MEELLYRNSQIDSIDVGDVYYLIERGSIENTPKIRKLSVVKVYENAVLCHIEGVKGRNGAPILISRHAIFYKSELYDAVKSRLLQIERQFSEISEAYNEVKFEAEKLLEETKEPE